MGGEKNTMMELQQHNLNSIPNKNLCIKHIDETIIKRFIKNNYQDGFCDYCQKEMKVVSLEEVMEFMMLGISNFYDDAANFMGYNSREGGYLGVTYYPEELIYDCIGLETNSYSLSEDIVNSIEDIAWSEPDKYHDNQKDELMYRWSFFKSLIKHKSRYLFQQNGGTDESENVFLILKEFGRLVKQLNLIKKINSGTTVYRCRQHLSSEIIKEKERLVAPPDKDAIYPNRFSPSGISMLYSAFDAETAVLETISREDPDKDTITISEFKLKKDIYIIDFSKLPKLPSIFDYTKVRKHYPILFLIELVKDMTKDIEKNGKEHTEYVPTQVVTEFFRYPFNKNRQYHIEGIIYPSSKNKSKSSSVIFWNNAECIQNLDLINLTTQKI